MTLNACETPGPELLELAVQRMRVLAESNRMRLLLALEGGEASVGELADALGAPHQNVSKHVNVMFEMGLLSRRRDGSRVRYALADYTAPRLLRDVIAGVTGRIEELADLAA